jgi:hypothetical protein
MIETNPESHPLASLGNGRHSQEAADYVSQKLTMLDMRSRLRVLNLMDALPPNVCLAAYILIRLGHKGEILNHKGDEKTILMEGDVPICNFSGGCYQAGGCSPVGLLPGALAYSGIKNIE